MVQKWRERRVVTEFPSLFFFSSNRRPTFQAGLAKTEARTAHLPLKCNGWCSRALGLCWRCWLESRSVTRFWVRFISHATQKALPNQFTEKPDSGRPTTHLKCLWSYVPAGPVFGMCWGSLSIPLEAAGGGDKLQQGSENWIQSVYQTLHTRVHNLWGISSPGSLP